MNIFFLIYKWRIISDFIFFLNYSVYILKWWRMELFLGEIVIIIFSVMDEV